MNSLSLNDVLQVVLSLAAFFGGWLLKELFSRIEKLEAADRELAKSVNDLRVELPTNYTPKPEFTQLGDSIFQALRRIEDKLDGKADKE